MKHLLTILLILSGVIAQAQSDFEKMKASYARLGVIANDSTIKDAIRLKNTYVDVKLCVYIDEEVQKQGIAKLNRALGQWLVVAEIADNHTQTYVTHPKTKRRMIYYSHFVPQRLVPDLEGYSPTAAQYKKLGYYDKEAAKWGFLVYKNATTKTKNIVKNRK